MPEHARETTDLRGVGESVPRVVHQIWLQGGPVYPLLRPYVASVERVASDLGWEYLMWTEANVDSLSDKGRAIWDQWAPLCRTPAQRSDVLRYLILFEVGGLYLDTDVEIRALPGELCGAWICATQDAPGNPILARRQTNSCVIAAPPGHPFLRRCLDAFASADIKHRWSFGPELCWRTLGDDVQIWPARCWHNQRGWQWHGYCRGLYGHHYSAGTSKDTYRPYPLTQ